MPSEFGELAQRIIAHMCYSRQQIIHNTSYEPKLRLGILFESKSGFETNCRIPLLGLDDKRWFIVAEHGFKLEGDEEV